MSLLLAALAVLLGSGSLLLFALFLYSGPQFNLNLGLDENARLALDAALCLIFFVQHSLMLRDSFRRRLARHIAARFHGAIYAVVSGCVLLVLILLWQESEWSLLSAAGFPRVLFRAAFWTSVLCFAWTAMTLRSLDTFGIEPLMGRSRHKTPETARLTIRGPYGWVRHPFYFLSLVLIWANPDLTADRLLFNVLWTGWIVVGTRLEERDLVTTFGEPYRAYQRVVPMLVPYRMPRRRSGRD